VDSIGLVVVLDADDPDYAEVYVDGSVAGRPYRFLLDTGAARTQVVADPFLLAFAREGHHTSGTAFGGSRHSGVVELCDLAIGPLNVPSLLASLVPGDQPGAQNLIGMDVLRSHQCEFRFSTAELRLGETHSGVAWLPLHMDAVSHPYVQIEWAGIQADAVWDSGAGVTLVDHGFYRRWPNLFAPCGASVGRDAAGAEMAADIAMVASPSIGGIALPSHKVAVVDLSSVNATVERPMDFILGFTTLNQGDWQFDFPAARWSVSRRTPTFAAEQHVIIDGDGSARWMPLLRAGLSRSLCAPWCTRQDRVMLRMWNAGGA
jgi:hypothetical protein